MYNFENNNNNKEHAIRITNATRFLLFHLCFGNILYVRAHVQFRFLIESLRLALSNRLINIIFVEKTCRKFSQS